MTKDHNDIMWEAPLKRKYSSHMYAFSQFVTQKTKKDLLQWHNLYKWSINSPNAFWLYLSEYVGIKWIRKPETSYQPPPKGKMLGASWFSNSQLNYAANLLPPRSNQDLIISYNENGKQASLTSNTLHNRVAKLASSLKKQGLKKGDVVAGVLTNSFQAVEIMLATTSLGGIWTSCSPEFGWQGITERLEQVKPLFLFFTIDYCYNNKYIDCVPIIKKCLTKLPSLKGLVSILNIDIKKSINLANCQPYDFFINQTHLKSTNSKEQLPIYFTKMAFNDPLFILFTSGTTGAPKCVVHSVGGTLLQHKKELLLHTDLQKNNKLFFFTTTGWMMWNWMVSALSTEACIVTYDGSPKYPTIERLWKICDQEKVDIFGTSPTYISTCMRNSFSPVKNQKLTKLKTILTTGSPLLNQHYKWIYTHVKKDLHLASISGGTDIISCFMLGNPLLPVKLGKIQSPGLGMNISAKNDQGEDVINKKAELVCSSPFVSMPIYFLQDPNNTKYKKSYFEFFPNQEIWRHGDYITITPDNHITVHGRSDATLNPGGIRIGTAEIYRCVENIHEIIDSVAINYQKNDTTQTILFVKLEETYTLTDQLLNKVKAEIRTQLSPRHIPSIILQVNNIPYTRNGKKTELSVTKAMHGEKIVNLNSLINPGALKEYYKIKDQLQKIS